MCSGRTNQELISNLRREGLIHSTRVAEAMAKVDRKAYCPDPRSAYQDSPQTIGYSATISAPHMHAHAAEELLEYLKPDSSVLDVGSGSGYLAALFHHLVKPMPGHEGEVSGAHSGSRVIGIEHIEPLVKQSVENMKTDGLSDAMSKGQIEVVLGDGRKGWPARAPYNAIHVGAASPPSVIDALEAQLAKPGRLFIPVEDPASGAQDIYHVDKDESGKVTRKKMYGVRYVPLTDADKQWTRTEL
ncbi:protein-L-isoaspartate O-methyltransferase [Jaminaea rosea]|uniref:Protein-L-isoaspartate O-methyltransferase n=1 Tax=Jaminaea rosea TaxID=1569628 RepID=A0A316UYT6_9BASI|nr:protein-L-isoaspartate O-methyltransferase [Jaminaea rosea]PWN30154.1 protein-L-isoaspartate O-methyltransferase [Jaminaea rosea]